MISSEDDLLAIRLQQFRQLRDQDNDLASTQTEAEVREQARMFYLRTENFRDLYRSDEDVRDIVDRAIRLEGLASNISTHAAGDGEHTEADGPIFEADTAGKAVAAG